RRTGPPAHRSGWRAGRLSGSCRSSSGVVAGSLPDDSSASRTDQGVLDLRQGPGVEIGLRSGHQPIRGGNTIMTLTLISLIAVAALTALATTLVRPRTVSAHCDTADGPATRDGRLALETGNVNHALKWI